jgi:hypothetical protein
MKVYPMEGIKFRVADGDGPYEEQDGLTLMFPEEADKELNQFLSKYDIDIEFTWYFSDLEVNVWTCVCFTEEQDIAGHLVQSRTDISQVAFKPYLRTPEPDKNFVPKVGSLFISSKLALEDLSHRSELFSEIWSQLKDCEHNHRWLVIMDKIPDSVKAIAGEENRHLFHKNRTFQI